MIDFYNMSTNLTVLAFVNTTLSTVFLLFSIGRFFCLTVCEKIDKELMDENGWALLTIYTGLTIAFWVFWFLQWEFILLLIATFSAIISAVLCIGALLGVWWLAATGLEKLHKKIHNKKHGKSL